MVATPELKAISLNEFLMHPVDDHEWIDGQIVEKTGMTLRHGQIQARLSFYWRNYMLSTAQAGEVYISPPCRTTKQGRRPDVSYLTPELFSQYAGAAALPQSFPLIAEIASPDDSAEELFAKAKEYLESGCQEAWLVFPESLWIIVITQEQHLLLTLGEVASTQAVLQGFSVAVDELLA
ncbi:MAG TPA: Uma2 family endonuclease [Coleofasciculaceae cyanobacterium]|jgi:Uma2 family endonuclease